MKKLKNLLVIAGGIGLILWGLFHITFWEGLDWKNEFYLIPAVIKTGKNPDNGGSF